MERATADIIPDCLIEKIVFNLSFDKAAQTSILSKAWLQAWLIHPNLEFSIHYYKDMNIVNKIMERYRDEKIPIDKFTFSILMSGSREVFLLIDKWLRIAVQNGVKDLVCTGFFRTLYPFPIFTILTSKSLRELVLTDCDLMHLSLSSSHGVDCDSLEKLSLSGVRLDDNMLQTLLSTCPLIVNFVIEDCIGLENIDLLRLQKIRSVSIRAKRNQHVKIQAPTLEHLSCFGALKDPPTLDIAECPNLKSLELSRLRVYDGFFEHLNSRYQFLESLILVHISNRLEMFNICLFQSLRVLKIQDCKSIGEIDAPGLVSLEYKGDQVPELKIAKEPSQLQHSKVVLHCSNNLNATWFSKLRKFLSNSTSWSQVSLYFSKCNEINRRDLELDHRVATPQVDVLQVEIMSSILYLTFVDALLWSCHPRRLIVASSRKVLTSFIGRLMYMKNSSHSTSHGSKTWHSQLKKVKAYNWQNQSWHPVELKIGKLATTAPSEMEKYCFLLDW